MPKEDFRARGHAHPPPTDPTAAADDAALALNLNRPLSTARATLGGGHAPAQCSAGFRQLTRRLVGAGTGMANVRQRASARSGEAIPRRCIAFLSSITSRLRLLR